MTIVSEITAKAAVVEGGKAKGEEPKNVVFGSSRCAARPPSWRVFKDHLPLLKLPVAPLRIFGKSCQPPRRLPLAAACTLFVRMSMNRRVCLLGDKSRGHGMVSLRPA